MHKKEYTYFGLKKRGASCITAATISEPPVPIRFFFLFKGISAPKLPPHLPPTATRNVPQLPLIGELSEIEDEGKGKKTDDDFNRSSKWGR